MSSGTTTMSGDRDPDLAWLVGLARRLAHTGEDADDLAQETWLVALQNEPTKRSSRPWLAGVLRNVGRMRARSNMRRSAREQAVAPAESASPETMLAHIETLEALRRALDQLDPVDRRLVLGRYAVGQSAVQLGAQFDLLPSTVRTRLDRARQRLRREVESACGVACFVPWRVPVAGGSVGTPLGAAGVLAMSTATKITLGAVAIAVVAFGAQRWIASARESSPKTGTTSAAAAVDPRISTKAVPRPPATPQAQQEKHARIRERRAQRLGALPIDVSEPSAASPTEERCIDGCIGTLTMQLAVANAISGCADQLDPEVDGETKFRAHVIAEPDVGAVISEVEVLEDELGNTDFTECIAASAPLAQLDDPENPISDAFVFRYSVGVADSPDTAFFADHPDLLAAHPEFARMAEREPGVPVAADDATAFAQWIEQDVDAQAAFSKWSTERGLDLAHVRVD